MQTEAFRHRSIMGHFAVGMLCSSVKGDESRAQIVESYLRVFPFPFSFLYSNSLLNLLFVAVIEDQRMFVTLNF